MTGGLKLRDRERARFFFFVAVNGLMSSGLTIGLSVSEALFLSRSDLGPGKLPVVFIFTAVATALSTVVYAAYVDKVRNDRYFQLIHGVAIAALLLVVWGMQRDLTPAFMAFYGFYYVAQGVFNTHFWNYATDYFDAVEAKRLFPFFPLGNSVGGFCGGMLASLLGSALGPLGLTALWLAIMLGTIALIGIVSPRLRGWVVSESEEKDEASLSNVRQGFAFLLRSAMGRWHVAYALVMVTSLFFLQYLYSDILSRAYPDSVQLTAFIGRFLAITNVVEIVLEVAFTPHLIARVGVGASNAFYPLSTMLGFVLIGTMQSVGAAVYSRMNRETFDNAISGACRNLLYNAYPARFRGRIRAFIEGAVTNAGLVMAGLAIVGLAHVVGPERRVEVVTWLGAASTLVFLGIALLIRHAYLSTLVHGLKEYRLDLEDVSLEIDKVKDEELNVMLPALEAGEDAASLSLVRRILGVLATRGGREAVMTRLVHPNPRLQLAAIDVLCPPREASDASAASALAPRLEASLKRVLDDVGQTSQVRARALEALDAGQAPALTAAWLEDADPHVRAAAAAAIVQRDGCPEGAAAWGVIHRMLGTSDARERTAMLGRLPVQRADCRDLLLAQAHDLDDETRYAVLDRIQHLDPRDDEVRRRIQPLLDDRNDEVRAAAVAFLSRTDDPHMLDGLARRLDDPSLVVRRKAVQALSGRGEQVARIVQPLLDARSSHTVGAALMVLGSLKSEGARERLRGWLHDRLVLAHEAVIAMSVLPTVMSAVTTRLDPNDAIGVEQARITTEPLAMIALRDLMVRMKGYVLDGLEALEDPTVIRNIRRCLETRLRQARGDAMEALSSLRERTLAHGLLALLDDGSQEEQVAASLAWQGQERCPSWPEIQARLQQHPDRWIRVAVAILAEQTEPGSGGTEYRQTEEYAVMKNLLFLKKVPLFAHMSLEQLEVISRIVNEIRIFRGEVIFREDEIGDKLYVIVEGKVNVVKNHRTSNEVTLATLHETDYFGEMSVLDNEPRSATVVAAADAHLLSISGEKLRDIVQQKPEIAFEIFKVLSARLRRADQKLSEMSRTVQHQKPALEEAAPS